MCSHLVITVDLINNFYDIYKHVCIYMYAISSSFICSLSKWAIILRLICLKENCC